MCPRVGEASTSGAMAPLSSIAGIKQGAAKARLSVLRINRDVVMAPQGEVDITCGRVRAKASLEQLKVDSAGAQLTPPASRCTPAERE